MRLTKGLFHNITTNLNPIQNVPGLIKAFFLMKEKNWKEEKSMTSFRFFIINELANLPSMSTLSKLANLNSLERILISYR